MGVYIHSHDLQKNETEILVLTRPPKALLFLSLLESVSEDPFTLAIKQTINGDSSKNKCS